MRKPLSLTFALGGILLLVLGVFASESISSSFSRMFTGEPTDRAIWLMLGGLAAVGVGIALARRTSPG